MLAFLGILSWFVDHHVKAAVMAQKRLVEEEDMEIRPGRIPSSCLNEDIMHSKCSEIFFKRYMVCFNNYPRCASEQSCVALWSVCQENK